MKKIILAWSVFAIIACGSDKKENNSQGETKAETEKKTEKKERRSRKKDDKGIGPVTELKLPDTIDQAMATEGKAIFEAKCTACHKPTEKYIGPAPKGVLDRRTPEWVMNMILNPEEMLQKDPIAKQLYRDNNGAVMANQNLKEDEARKVLEFFRTIE
ncbi:MAG: c-type cytochrome [Flavobacteriales bacterium]